jgi:hypothetical protein
VGEASRPIPRAASEQQEVRSSDFAC